MLTALQAQQQRRRRPVPSLKQQYQEYVLQRIEGYKNSLSRRELMELGDEALAEMEAAENGQFFLTEVLLADWVDRLIYRRLGLQPYSRWARHFRELRAAQREPTRWGIDPRSPVTRILPRLEPGDTALVIGSDAAPVAYLLAAHDVEVVFTGPDLTFVDQVESRVAEEALGHYCATYVAPVGHLPPGLPPVHVVVFDTGALDGETASSRRRIVQTLQEQTAPGGVHLIVPTEHALAPEAYLSHYSEWIREDLESRRRRPQRRAGILLGKPPSEDTATGSARGHGVPA
ncbi:MAG TPA: hypothetical protein VNJ71_00805 [Gemmatimonadales bacterium]|jgi:hypothetical protein|nr:hypothetical protein [Gemmatimonadales bacterium]